MEDLNIERMKLRIITRCWYDIKAFRTIGDISNATGLSERTITRFARDNNFPRRSIANVTRHNLRERLLYLCRDL